jgi:hypothetical protein
MAYHIRLSDHYDASGDIRRYLMKRFADIGRRIGDPQWFSRENIETLVRAGAGQFVYVATVYKYISEPRASPAERLKIVLTWTPHEGQATRPFEALDRLYTGILLAAKTAYEAVDTHHGRDFLLLFRTYLVIGATLYKSAKRDVLPVLLRLPVRELRPEESLISDLRSLVYLETTTAGGIPCLHLYHKSFSDFLGDPSRAKDLFMPEYRAYAHLAKCSMQHIMEYPSDLEPRTSLLDDRDYSHNPLF